MRTPWGMLAERRRRWHERWETASRAEAAAQRMRSINDPYVHVLGNTAFMLRQIEYRLVPDDGTEVEPQTDEQKRLEIAELADAAIRQIQRELLPEDHVHRFEVTGTFSGAHGANGMMLRCRCGTGCMSGAPDGENGAYGMRITLPGESPALASYDHADYPRPRIRDEDRPPVWRPERKGRPLW